MSHNILGPQFNEGLPSSQRIDVPYTDYRKASPKINPEALASNKAPQHPAAYNQKSPYEPEPVPTKGPRPPASKQQELPSKKKSPSPQYGMAEPGYHDQVMSKYRKRGEGPGPAGAMVRA